MIRFSGSGSAPRLEAELVLAGSLTRRSSRIGSARTRLEARYPAQLCSKLGSASRLGDRLGVRLGAQFGLTRRLSSRPGAPLEARLGLGSRLGARIPLGFVRTRSGSAIGSIPTQLGIGSGLRSSWLSLERHTERALGLGQAGERRSSVPSPSLARRAAQLVGLLAA